MSLKEELQQYLGIMCEVRDAKQRAAELGRRIREAEATQVSDSISRSLPLSKSSERRIWRRGLQKSRIRQSA